MSLADSVTPITPFTVLKWFSYAQRDDFVTDRSVPAEQQTGLPPYKKGQCDGAPFCIYKDVRSGKTTFLGHSGRNPNTMMRADRWEYIIWDFEDKTLRPVYFERT